MKKVIMHYCFIALLLLGLTYGASVEDYGRIFQKLKNYPHGSETAVPMRGIIDSWNKWYYYNNVIKPKLKTEGSDIAKHYTWTQCSHTDCSFEILCFQDNPDCKPNGNNGNNGNRWECVLDECCGTSCEKDKP